MFGLGMPEILLILAIALIVIGPKKLPELAKTLGRAMGEFKRSAQDLKRSIDAETTIQEVKKDLDIPKVDLNKILSEEDPKQEQNAGPDKETDPAADKKGSRPEKPADQKSGKPETSPSESKEAFTYQDLGRDDNPEENDKK